MLNKGFGSSLESAFVGSRALPKGAGVLVVEAPNKLFGCSGTEAGLVSGLLPNKLAAEDSVEGALG